MCTEIGRIYKIVNKINQKVYIGYTVNSLQHRFNEHLYTCFKSDSNSKLYNSIKKYGKENFEIILITECNLSEIYETEKKYIKEYRAYEDGMNSTVGGEGCLGYVHSPEIRKKISEGTKNGNSHKGKTYEELYGDKAEEEKLKRKVASGWKKLTEEEKRERVDVIRTKTRESSKYGVKLIKEIKDKLRDGVKIKELRKLYPQVYYNLFYDLKNNIRWKDI